MMRKLAFAVNMTYAAHFSQEEWEDFLDELGLPLDADNQAVIERLREADGQCVLDKLAGEGTYLGHGIFHLGGIIERA
jgi:hypothetical protein